LIDDEKMSKLHDFLHINVLRHGDHDKRCW